MENAPASPFDFPELVQALAALGPADMSMNEAAAKQPGSSMLTNAGSKRSPDERSDIRGYPARGPACRHSAS
jgi:hypothetical protein